MGKQDDELLTMGRIKRLLAEHPAATRYRIATWIISAVNDMDDPTPAAPDPRQLPLIPTRAGIGFPE